MAALPYITATGSIDRALDGIKRAQVPERVSQDFVKQILKIPGGSGNQMTSFLKKMDFVTSDGTPTELYKKFRNPSSSGQAVAAAIRHAYAPLYLRAEYMHKLSEDDLLGLIVEETGHPHDSNQVKLAFACIKALKLHANFDEESSKAIEEIDHQESGYDEGRSFAEANMGHTNSSSVGLNLGYTIN